MKHIVKQITQHISTMTPNTGIIICGPTASGKSKLAMDIAKDVNSNIINIDDMQCYKDLPILSDQPSFEDAKMVQHSLYGELEYNQKNTIAKYLKRLESHINLPTLENKRPIIVGGSGFYIQSLLSGMSPVPDIDDPKIKEFVQNLSLKHPKELYKVVRSVDQLSKIEENDLFRLERSYSVFLQTGKPFSHWLTVPKVKVLKEWKFLLIIIDLDNKIIENNISKRLLQIIKKPQLLDEVRILNEEHYDAIRQPISKTIGFKDCVDFSNCKINLKTLYKNIRSDTIKYAKRQLTWNRHQFKNYDYKMSITLTEDNLENNYG
ncbi:MAG: tRNA (adenosine(37)-N6)-dimethylallyltransferase MiaA [Alphaproteobacteria bacterium]|nr:tRNA (adenosine(37)-N6)-dimethylallyltransferase MiaA [Alphaproteobacteria bacterium]MBL0718248.1 tRNA (adenosine(37)-N6)-dimethylallyltransferase MiaA [Alphaproteobacteria bacterium]